jgi:hypothetical protein
MTDTLNATPVTWDTGGMATPGPAMVVHPDRQVVDADLSGVADGSGLNGPFIADLLASCAAHERLGLNLLKTLEARTNNPVAKHRFNDFQADSLAAVAAYEELMANLGVPGGYTSPPARMTDAIDTRMVSAFLLSGSADQPTLELKGVEAVLLASTLCLANISLLRSIAETLDEGPVTTAFESAADKLSPPATEHFEWAAKMQHELVLAQAKSGLAQTVTAAAEAVVGKVRDVLGR